MEVTSCMFYFVFVAPMLILCSTSGSFPILVKDFGIKELRREDEQLDQTIQHNSVIPSFPTFPASPITNPVTVTVPPDISTPGGVAIPSANPVTVTPAATPVTIPPSNPITNPANPTVPITNPVTTPSSSFPGGQPVSGNNPSTTYPAPINSVPTTTPATPQPDTSNAPAVPGQSWCVARNGVPEPSVQTALDYACGIGGADCSAIQQGANCYNPNTMQNHASYAFNSYYQRNPVQTSCDFGGTAFITNVNPSSGSCIYPTWSSSASPNTVSPVTTAPSIPTTASSTGAIPVSSGAPTGYTAGTPAIGEASTGFGEFPTTSNTSSTSMSNRLQPFISSIIIVASGSLLWIHRGSH